MFSLPSTAKLNKWSLWAYRLILIGVCYSIARTVIGIGIIGMNTLGDHTPRNRNSSVHDPCALFLFTWTNVGIALTVLAHQYIVHILASHRGRWFGSSIWDRGLIAIDIFFLFIELSCSLYYSTFTFTFTFVSSIFLSVGLAGLLVIRITIANRMRRKFRSLIRTDFSETWKIGRGLHHLSGEHPVLQIIRGVLTLVILYSLAVFVIYVSILEPVWETSSKPMKAHQTADFNMSHFSDGWTIWVSFPRQQSYPTSSPSIPLVNAAIIEGMSCDQKNSIPPDYIFFCQSQEQRDDALITVHFTPSTQPSTAHILVGMTSNTTDIQYSTDPVVLDQGSHLRAHIGAKVREVYNQSRFAALGIHARTRRYPFAETKNLIPDSSALVRQINDTNTATLRVTMMDRSGVPYWTVLADDRDKTVLKGLATAGGFWTLIDGIFSILLGGNLLYCLFGVKPLSVFGLLHWRQKDKLCRINSIPDLSSPLAIFLNRYLIDLGMETKEDGPAATDSRDLEMNDIGLLPDPAIGTQADDFVSSLTQYIRLYTI